MNGYPVATVAAQDLKRPGWKWRRLHELQNLKAATLQVGNNLIGGAAMETKENTNSLDRACPRLREFLWPNALAAEKSGHGSPKRLPCPKFEAYDLVTTLNPSSNCDHLHLPTRPSSSTSLRLWPT
jgi:hypothetical protein